MTGKGKPSRKRIAVSPADEQRILDALERWAGTQDFIALRTRALVYLLWDGSLRTRAAVRLNAEEVVADPAAPRVSIVRQVIQGPHEVNRYRQVRFFVSKRTRDALRAYLTKARQDGFLVRPVFEGPLFVSMRKQRLSARSAVHSWLVFLRELARPSRPYQLDDIVYTGRLAFLKAAGGDSSLLSGHANLSEQWAAEYEKDLPTHSGARILDVLERLHRP